MLKTSCRYKVDINDVIIEVEGAWADVASCNNGRNRDGSGPVGRPIWDFIQGLSTKNIYRVLMKQVRQTGATVQFPFRVDYVTFMEMKMSPGREKSIWFQTINAPTNEHRSNNGNGQEPKTPRKSSIVNMCAWCNQVLVGAEWLPLERAIRTLDLFEKPEAPPISHGLCPSCVPHLKRGCRIY